MLGINNRARRWACFYALPLIVACGSSGNGSPSSSAGAGGRDESAGAGGKSSGGGGAASTTAGTGDSVAGDGATAGKATGGESSSGSAGSSGESGAAGNDGPPPVLPPALTFKAESSAILAPFGIWGSAANDVYAVGNSGVIIHSTGDGTWTKQTTDTNSTLTGVWGSSSSDIYVSVNSNFLLHSTGDGKWQHQTAAPGEVFRDIWGASATQLFALVGGGVDLSTGDADWGTHVTINDSGYTRAIWGASAHDVFVATDYNSGPTVYRLTDSGDWSGDLGSPQVSLTDITGISPKRLYVTGVYSVFSSNGDGNWTAELTVQGELFQAVWAAGPDTVYACTSKGTFYRSNGAGSWSDSQLIDPVKGAALGCQAIWSSDVDNVYIGSDGAGIYHATR